jgi:hypothetical protein
VQVHPDDLPAVICFRHRGPPVPWWRRMLANFQHPPGAEARSFIASQRDGPDRRSATLRRFPPYRRRCPPAAFRDTRDIRGPGGPSGSRDRRDRSGRRSPPGCQPGQHAARQAALTPQETHPCDPVAVPVPASGLLCYHHDGALPWSEQRRWSIAVVVQGRRMGSAGNDGAGVTNGTGTAAGRRPTPSAGPTRPAAHQTADPAVPAPSAGISLPKAVPDPVPPRLGCLSSLAPGNQENGNGTAVASVHPGRYPGNT